MKMHADEKNVKNILSKMNESERFVFEMPLGQAAMWAGHAATEQDLVLAAEITEQITTLLLNKQKKAVAIALTGIIWAVFSEQAERLVRLGEQLDERRKNN